MSSHNAIYSGAPDGVPITVTDVSITTNIAATSYEAMCEDIIVTNTGTEPCWIRTGGPDVMATTASLMMPGQWREVFRKGPVATHLAAICQAGKSTTLTVAPVSDGD